MSNTARIHDDEEAYTIGGRTYQEAAAYMASFIAYVNQRAPDQTLTVEAISSLGPGDQRALR